MSKYILTIDQGTTSCRSLLVDKEGRIIKQSQIEFRQHFPKSGWVEHNALEIFNTQVTTIESVLGSKVKIEDINAVGITNQRETIVVWNVESGLPIYNAIVWQDQRTVEFCEKWSKKSGWSAKIKNKTGLVINPYFSGTKLKWILDNVEGARKLASQGKLLAGTIDSWLIWKLTSGKVHATDVSNASRTLLFNIKTLKWDEEILKELNIPMNILPEVKSSSEIYGNIDLETIGVRSSHRLPIAGVAGDQQSALFGQLCVNKGELKNTYGTGCFTLVNTGQTPVESKNNLLTTIAWQIGKNSKPFYALEGSVFIAGAAIQWMRDALRLIYNASEIDLFSSLVPEDDNQRIYVVPAFTGLGAPYWDTSARGAIMGLERGTKREHIVKAVAESIAYQSNDLIKAMSSDLKSKIKVIKVDGGASKSNFIMQFQSSIGDLEVSRPVNKETTAMGAAYLAGLATGFWKNINELKKIAKVERIFKPDLTPEKRKNLLVGWEEAVSRTIGWTHKVK